MQSIKNYVMLSVCVCVWLTYLKTITNVNTDSLCHRSSITFKCAKLTWMRFQLSKWVWIYTRYLPRKPAQTHISANNKNNNHKTQQVFKVVVGVLPHNMGGRHGRHSLQAVCVVYIRHHTPPRAKAQMLSAICVRIYSRQITTCLTRV